MAKQCKRCNKQFEPTRRTAKYCSESCRNKYNSNKRRKAKRVYTRMCPVCEVEFTTVIAHKITCSSVCSKRLNYIQQQEKRRSELKESKCTEEVRMFLLRPFVQRPEKKYTKYY